MADFDTQQQLLADQLRRYQAQAQTQAPQGRQVGRVYVAPNPLEYLAAGLRGYGGMKGEQQTQQAIGDLAEKRRAAMVEQLRGFGQAMQGTPEVPAADVADGPGQTFTAPAIPAKAGDPMAAYQMLLGGDSPELQKVGMQGIASTAQAQQQRAQALADEERKRLAKEAETKRIMGILSAARTPQDALAAGVPAELVKTYYDQGLGKTKLSFVDGTPVDPYSGKTAGAAIPQRAPVPNTATDLLIPDPANPGKMIPNQPLIDAKKGIAKAGASNLSVDARNYNTQEGEQSKAYGKTLGEMRGEIQKAGLAAPGKLARLSRMEQLLDGIDGGAVAPAMADIASFANSIGVKIDPKLGNKQAAQALSVEMALAMRQPGSGASTDKDFDNWMATVPDLSKTAEGRKQIITTMRAAIERDQRAAKFAREYAKANKGVIDDEFFEVLADWYAQNPVITPKLPAANSRGQAFDPDKERRYQEWLKRQGGK